MNTNTMNTTLANTDSNETQAQGQSGRQQTVRPRADIYEAEGTWHLILEMPGVDESGTNVSVEKNVLTITGSVDIFNTEGFDQQFGDFASRRFERSFRLPEDVDTAAIEAEVKNGVLRLRLPKAQSALPHKVTVKAG